MEVLQCDVRNILVISGNLTSLIRGDLNIVLFFNKDDLVSGSFHVKSPKKVPF